MIKKIKTELVILFLLLISIFFSYDLDLGLYFYFNGFDENLNLSFLKKFFVNITTLGDSFWYFFFCIIGIIFIEIKKSIGNAVISVDDNGPGIPTKEYQNVFKWIIIFSVIVNIVLNVVLIPSYGIFGAAVASMISLILWNILSCIYIYKK